MVSFLARVLSWGVPGGSFVTGTLLLLLVIFAEPVVPDVLVLFSGLPITPLGVSQATRYKIMAAEYRIFFMSIILYYTPMSISSHSLPSVANACQSFARWQIRPRRTLFFKNVLNVTN
jgi:hypothetical protein